MAKEDVDMSWSKLIKRFRMLRWFHPNPLWCHGFSGLSSTLIGGSLIVQGARGNFEMHQSFWLFLYYSSYFIIMSSTWSMTQKRPAYKTIYRCITVQALSFVYFGIRFLPMDLNLNLSLPDTVFKAADIISFGSLLSGVCGTIFYGFQISRGVTDVDTSFGPIAVAMSSLNLPLVITTGLLAFGYNWLDNVFESDHDLCLCLTAFGFVPATWMLSNVGNFNNLKNRKIFTETMYKNGAWLVVLALPLLASGGIQAYLK